MSLEFIGDLRVHKCDQSGLHAVNGKAGQGPIDHHLVTVLVGVVMHRYAHAGDATRAPTAAS